MNKPEYIVDKGKCIKCGNCQYICSGLCAKINEEGYPYIDEVLDHFCFSCGQCVSVCPTGALRHTNVDLDQCEVILPPGSEPSDQIEHLIKTRRSIRNFKDEPVSREGLEELLDVVRYAPTGGNAQGVKFIVMDKRETLHKVFQLTSDYLTDFVSRPENAWLLLPADAGKTENDWVFWNAPMVIIATADNPTDLSIALAYLDLYAQAKGLGCCWCGYLKFAMDGGQPELMEMFQKAGLDECYYPMMIGVPEERIKYYRIPQRKQAEINYIE